MEPGGQRKKVRAGMTIVFTHPCFRGITHNQDHHLCGEKQSGFLRKNGKWLSASSIARAQQRTTSQLLDPLGDIGTYMSGAVLESLEEQQFPPRESQVHDPEKGAAQLGEEGRISTFQVQSAKVRALQQCKLFRVRFCQDCEFKPEPSPHR